MITVSSTNMATESIILSKCPTPDNIKFECSTVLSLDNKDLYIIIHGIKWF